MVSLTGKLHERVVFGRRIRRLSESIAGLLPENARVLDVGCGDGRLAALIATARPDVTITGVDVLVRPRTAVPVVPFDGATLPFEPDAFDVCLLVDVLHHTDDPAALLRETQRVSRRSVIVKDHCLDGIAARATLSVMDWFGNAHHGVRLPYNYLTSTQWRAMFVTLGLTVDQWQSRLRLYPPPLTWVFDRKLHFLAVVGTE